MHLKLFLVFFVYSFCWFITPFLCLFLFPFPALGQIDNVFYDPFYSIAGSKTTNRISVPLVVTHTFLGKSIIFF